jgi:DNA-binding CsgD family transcriptional regulator
MTVTHPPAFLGRMSERGLLDRLLADAQGGRSGVLVIRGDPGIGKTALLRYVARQAAGFRVAQATGVQAEMELPFAGIHQLCAPMLGRLDQLPGPQGNALRVALSLTSGDVPEPLLVSLAVLSLLSAVAEERPLLCLIEDAQWLDAASGQIVGFVARRVLAESIAIVVAVRNAAAGHDFDGLPELRLVGLERDDARALLAGAVHGRLHDGLRDRIVAETRGNPLALLELPRRMSAAELAGGFEVPGGADLPEHIEGHYLQRVDQLPDDTQQLLLLAAADPLGDATLVWRAGAKLEIGADALAPATDAQLLEIGAQVRFRHPLVRSAVYRAAPPDRRQRVHEALAAVTDPEADADRRAWHRALAAPGADEAVAAELERSAVRAQTRGGVAAAAAFLQRAAVLTPDRARRLERSLAAAQASLAAGAFTDVRGLLSTAEAGPLDEAQRARIDLVRAQLAFASRRGNEATPLLLSAARRLESVDLSLARETYVDAFSSALFGARLSDSVGVPEVAEAARVAPRVSGEPSTADLLLDALVGLSENYESAIGRCGAAVQRLLGEEASHKERLRWLWQGCVIALEMWDDESAYQLSHDSVDIARETGTLSELALALSAHTPVLVFSGELSDASAAVAETTSVQDASGIASAPYGALILGAWQGKANETRQLIELTLAEVGGRGEGIGVAICEYARAVLCNGLGDYDAARRAAYSASEHREVVAENWGLSELIEPAMRTGNTELVADALARLTRKAMATGTAWALGIEARSRALLSEGDQADSGFREAITLLSRTRVRAELARTQLLYGEWLRRVNRRLDAREQLRTAHDLFSSMGMEAFAERARHERHATGENVRKRVDETRDDLTPQERQIAGLASEGLSNVEIGARLFLSPRTVEWHLRHVFTKLGIRSRRQLETALPRRDAAGVGSDAART